MSESGSHDSPSPERDDSRPGYRPRFLTQDYPEMSAAVDMSRRVGHELAAARIQQQQDLKAIRDRTLSSYDDALDALDDDAMLDDDASTGSCPLLGKRSSRVSRRSLLNSKHFLDKLAARQAQRTVRVSCSSAPFTSTSCAG